MGDFNETIGDDAIMMAQVLTAGRITDVDTNRHGHDVNIATYIRSK